MLETMEERNEESEIHETSKNTRKEVSKQIIRIPATNKLRKEASKENESTTNRKTIQQNLLFQTLKTADTYSGRLLEVPKSSPLTSLIIPWK